MDSIQAAQAVAEWAEKGQTAAPPAWEELPSIPLYMDQVILYLGESLELIPHPQKKKYAKEHLAGLMAVCMLKQVLSIQDVKTLLGSGEISPQTYQLFRQAHTAALQETCQALEETCRSGQDLKQAALLLAAEANAKRAAAQRILCELGREDPGKAKGE